MLKRRLLRINKTVLSGVLLCFGFAVGMGQSAAADVMQNAIEKVEASSISGQTLIKVTMREPLAAAPSSFTVSTPARVAFDFVDTENASGSNAKQYALADLQSVNVVQAGNRTRLVLNLNRSSSYETRLDGHALYISLASGPSGAMAATQSKRASPISSASDANSVQDIDFRAESSDVAKITIDVADPNPLVDVKRQGSSLVVSLVGVKLPNRLARRLDVRDFGTPVVNATATSLAQGTQITIATRGDWDYSVTQLDTTVQVDILRKIVDPTSLAGAKELQGKTVSFNFTQPVPVSQMIGIFQDITGLNFVMMPGVTGEVERIKMENTPVETAINVINRMYGLAMRRFDGVVMVGKAADIAKYEKEEADLQNSRIDTEPIEQASIKAKYRPASELVAAVSGVVTTFSDSSTQSNTISAQAIGGGGAGGKDAQGARSTSTAVGKSMISPRGSVSYDSVTNIIFVEETKTQIAKIRERINELDRPVRQVMIDARIVSVNNTFSRLLGTKLGFIFAQQGATVTGSPNVINTNGGLNGVTAVSVPKPGVAVSSGGFNAANGDRSSLLQFALTNSNGTRLLNAELNASEVDGTTKNIASPKVLTQDGRQATITDGVTLFFELSNINGVSTVTIDAATKLEVTPQIGSDGKVQMKVYVNKGGVGATFAGRPSVIKQEVVTNAVIENGGTLMLGGVFTQTASNSTNGVPVLRDIPGLGWLFKENVNRDEKTELLIFLTPRIVTEELTLQ